MKIITDKAEWSDLLSQSQHSQHGHSVEYQQIIQMNDPRHSEWINYLFEINGERYLMPCEQIGDYLLSQEKYYAGMIPLDGMNYLNIVISAFRNFLYKINKHLMLSYLETDNIFKYLKEKISFKIAINNGWTDASIMNVEKDYQEVWNKVYDTKTRNMIRKSHKELEFRQINILDHIGDAIDCTKSKEVRHGSLMPNYYRDCELFRARQTRLAEILQEQAISFGAFCKGKLVAYINTIRSYHEAIISNLLSNANYWNLAPNNGLFDFMIQHYCKDGRIRQLMYSFDGVESVDRFKHSMGFRPVKVFRCVMQ